MKQVIMLLGGAFAVVGLFVAFVFFVSGAGQAHDRVFLPIQEETRRRVFEESRAFREGTAQHLQAMQVEYIKASDSHKQALRSIIVHEAAGIPEGSLSRSLEEFINGLKREQGLLK